MDSKIVSTATLDQDGNGNFHGSIVQGYKLAACILGKLWLVQQEAAEESSGATKALAEDQVKQLRSCLDILLPQVECMKDLERQFNELPREAREALTGQVAAEDMGDRSAALHASIRQRARKDSLVAHRRQERWYFSNFSNYLESPEQGLDDEEAVEWLDNVSQPKVTRRSAR